MTGRESCVREFWGKFVAEKLSILLIEDDIHDVENVQRVISTVQPPIFDFQHAPRFLDAIQLVRKNNFHVVLLDLGLPDSVGLNGITRLMSLIPTVPVIVLTGLDDDDALTGIELGAQEFLDKDEVDKKHLIRAIRHAIKRKQHSLRDHSAASSEHIDQRIEELAKILRTTSTLVTSKTDSLMHTELSQQQRSLVSEIEKTSIESVQAADRISSETSIFIEAE